MFAKTWEWFANNWGNLASVIGLVLAVPSLIYSYLAWEEAKSVDEAFETWRAREERKRCVLLAKQLRGSIRSAQTELDRCLARKGTRFQNMDLWRAIADDLTILLIHDSEKSIALRQKELEGFKSAFIGVSPADASAFDSKMLDNLRICVLQIETELERDWLSSGELL